MSDEKEIEVTEAMMEAGASVIFATDGVAPLGIFFSGHDLASEVFQAMWRCRNLERPEK